jgi:hypothetical protein
VTPSLRLAGDCPALKTVSASGDWREKNGPTAQSRLRDFLWSKKKGLTTIKSSEGAICAAKRCSSEDPSRVCKKTALVFICLCEFGIPFPEANLEKEKKRLAECAAKTKTERKKTENH